MNRHQKSARREGQAARQLKTTESVTIWERLASLFVPKKGRKLRTSLFVVVLFLGLIGYLVKFTIYDAPEVINSPYNKRTTALSEKVLRGSIKSANDKVLAETTVDEDGDEVREYPYEDMFAHVVGYNSHGKAGLESAYNYDLLTSHEQLVDQIREGVSGEKTVGDTIVTTLDTRLQKAAYNALGDHRGGHRAEDRKSACHGVQAGF